jgi:NAD+ kinase
MKKIGLVYHPLNEKALVRARQLAKYIEAQHLIYWLSSAWEPGDIQANMKGTDFIITAGGDGTILRTAQAVTAAGVPILGVNLGRLGFLTELSAGEAETKLPGILAGEGWLDERSMLKVEVDLVGGSDIKELHALNDVVVARGEIARIIHITAFINGQEMTTYKSDGLIAATATGSTGYALAAGGPVLHPQAHDYLLVPIAAHISMHYPLVLPPDIKVKLVLSTNNPAILSIDGHISLPLCDGATISLESSPLRTRFLRLRPKSYFYSSLEKKLRGQL